MNNEIKEIFKQWKQFLSWCYENNDKTTEIHRDNLERVIAYTRQLENIIKEVRECLNKNRVYIAGERNLAFEIEQILDKGE